MMPRPHFILDTNVLDMEIAARRPVAALCLDKWSGRCLGSAVSSCAENALIAALGDAVFTAGPPATVTLDNALVGERLMQEIAALGAAVKHVQPYSGTAKPIERLFRDLLLDWGMPEISITDGGSI